MVLFADWKEIQPRAEDILRRAAGRPGHIFNLGHGILPETPVDNVKRLCKFVQEHGPATASRKAEAARNEAHRDHRRRNLRSGGRLRRSKRNGAADKMLITFSTNPLHDLAAYYEPK